MKLTGHVEKWASGVLGAVSLVLLVNLVLQFSGVRAGSSHPAPSSTSATPQDRFHEVSARGSEEVSRYDPVVRLDLLKQFQSRRLPELARNPFEFEALPAPPPPQAQSPAAQAPAQPPPPPPVTLKPMGYAEKADGAGEAYVSDEEQVYVVHEGDSVAGKYKILKITPTSVTVEDVLSHRTVELPIPQ